MNFVNIEFAFSNIDDKPVVKMLFENIPEDESVKFMQWYMDRGSYKDKDFYFCGSSKKVTYDNIVAYNIIK